MKSAAFALPLSPAQRLVDWFFVVTLLPLPLVAFGQFVVYVAR